VNSLAVRATVGALQTLGLLGLVLFVPALTLDYPQAWIYLAIFATAVALITAYLLKNDPALLERRIVAGPIAEKRKPQKIIHAIALCAFLAIFLSASFDHRFGWSYVPPLLEAGGAGLTAVGFFVVFLVFRENSFASGTIGVWSGQQVVSSGPYAAVRHPMYSGALLMLIGTPLTLGSFWALVAVVPLAAAIVWRLLDEEAFLQKNLPGYAEYCRRVRSRLVPYAW
jgi:protein-S-isoprenylcysteine O-methyltransferase Ste14